MPNLIDQFQHSLPDPNLDPEEQDLSLFTELVPKSLNKIVQERAKDLALACTAAGYIAEWAKEGTIPPWVLNYLFCHLYIRTCLPLWHYPPPPPSI